MCRSPLRDRVGKFPEPAVAEEYEADVFGPGRRLVGQPTSQVTLLATLQRVRPAERRRPGEAGGDGTHDRPRHEGIRCPVRIGADRLEPGGNRVELRRAVHEWNGTATSRMTVDSPESANYQRPLSVSGTRD